MAEGSGAEISPREASWTGAAEVRDEDLPMLAALWLTQGYDSDELWELAGMTRLEGREGGRRLLAGVLSSLGWPLPSGDNPTEELPWRGYWHQIAWAKKQMDRLLAPYAAAQEVISVAGDVPDLWVPAGGQRLTALLRAWDEHPAERHRINDQIRDHLRSLSIEDVPPLIGGQGTAREDEGNDR